MEWTSARTVVCWNGSAASEAALEWALRRSRDTGSTIELFDLHDGRRVYSLGRDDQQHNVRIPDLDSLAWRWIEPTLDAAWRCKAARSRRPAVIVTPSKRKGGHFCPPNGAQGDRQPQRRTSSLTFLFS